MSKIHIVGNGAAAITMVLQLVKQGSYEIEWWGGRSVYQDVETHSVDSPPYGVAYRTNNRNHLLNAEAKNMSLFPDEASFPYYLAQHYPEQYGTDVNKIQDVFASRLQYRQYLRSLLRGHWKLINSQVNFCEDISEVPADLEHSLDSKLVLCLGAVHREMNVEHPNLVHSPWDFDYEQIRGFRKVRILGSGLTALDTALSVWDVDSAIEVEFFSRNGRFPLMWQPTQKLHEMEEARDSLRLVNQLIERESDMVYILPQIRWLSKKYGWQNVMATFRPHWSRMWDRLSPQDKRRFLGRVRPFWEIHRHRLTPQMNHQLIMHSHTINKYDPNDLSFWTESTGIPVFNATGVDTNPNCSPLLNQMIRRRMVTAVGPDKYRLYGLAATSDCKVGHNIWCVGAYMRWHRWESTAMSDIVDMVRIVGKQLDEL